MCVLWVEGGAPIKPKRVFLPLWMSERFECLLKGKGWLLSVIPYGIVHSPVIGPFKVMRSASSVLRKRSIASRGLGCSFKFISNDETILTWLVWCEFSGLVKKFACTVGMRRRSMVMPSFSLFRITVVQVEGYRIHTLGRNSFFFFWWGVVLHVS